MKENSTKKFIDKMTIPFAVIVLTIGIVTILIFTLSTPFNDWSFEPDSELFARYGNFIGGFVGTIFSFVGVLLLYQTLVAQQDSLKQQDSAYKIQKDSFEIEQFENTFFNLLKTQQELANGIKAYFRTINKKFTPIVTTIIGKEFFAYSNIELKRIWTSIDSSKYLGAFDEDDEYYQYLLKEIDEYYDYNSPNYCLPIDAKFKENQMIETEKLRFTNKHYNITEEVWNNIKRQDFNKRIEATYNLFFQRYHYAIGHYFRHLYHIIKFTKDFNVSVEHRDFRNKYIDFIQAQMSSFELMLLFYNALAFPKLFDLLKEFNFLENLAEEDLIIPTHNCIEEIRLKKRTDLLGFNN